MTTQPSALDREDFIEAWTFRVNCQPVPQPRENTRVCGKGPKQFVQHYVPDKHPVWNWKASVADAWRAIAPRPGYRMRTAVALAVRFILPRPEAMFYHRLAMGRVLDIRHIGDLDNLEKSLMDALTARVWEDDAYVAMKYSEKWIARGIEKRATGESIAEPLGADVMVARLAEDVNERGGAHALYAQLCNAFHTLATPRPFMAEAPPTSVVAVVDGPDLPTAAQPKKRRASRGTK